MEKLVGEHAAEDSAEASAKTRHRSGKSHLQDRHVTRLCQVDGKPCEEEPGQRGDAVLADVDADQHAMAQQHLDRGPGECVALRGSHIPMVGIHQTAAAFDGLDFGVRDARMLLYAVNVREPDQCQCEAQHAHEPEATLPAVRMNDPSEDRREDQQREILRRVENCGGSPSLRGGKPGGDDAAVSGEDGRLRKTGEQSQNEDRGECGAGGQVSRESREEGADRP